MRCLINEGQLSAAVVVIDAFLADFSSRFSPNWTLAVQNAPGQLTQTVVLSTFALGLLQARRAAPRSPHRAIGLNSSSRATPACG